MSGSYSANFKCDRCGRDDIEYRVLKHVATRLCPHCRRDRVISNWEDELLGMDKAYRDRMVSFVENIRRMMGHGYGEGDMEHMFSIVDARDKLYRKGKPEIVNAIIMGDPNFVMPEFTERDWYPLVQWETTETAPKDGREVLLYYKDYCGEKNFVVSGHWDTAGHEHDQTWVHSHGSGDADMWKPIPTAVFQ